VITVQHEFRARFRKDAPCMVQHEFRARFRKDAPCMVRLVALGSTQSLTEISTSTSLGVKAACAYGWQPCHFHVPTVWKSGSLNLLKSSGHVQACTGMAKNYRRYIILATDVSDRKIAPPLTILNFEWFIYVPVRLIPGTSPTDWPNSGLPHTKYQGSYQKQYIGNGDNLVTGQVAGLILVEIPRVFQVEGDGIIVFMIYNINLLFVFPATENSSEVQT